MKKTEEGWSFIETLIVIAIVLILTAGVGFSAIQYLDKARVVTAKSQIESFAVALESYYIDCGKYPSTEQGLAALWKKPEISPVPTNWNGPYMYKKIPNDPWGALYEYFTPGPEGLKYGIRSLGADGREGGENIDADIVSWE